MPRQRLIAFLRNYSVVTEVTHELILMTSLSIVGRSMGRQMRKKIIEHLRSLLDCMRTNNLYANASKCIFGADGIPLHVCFIESVI